MRPIKSAIGLLLCVLSGCVIHDDRQFVEVYRTDVSTVKPTTVVQSPKLKEEQVVVQKGCPPFVIPKRLVMPSAPDFSIVQTATVEEIIADYIKKLRVLIRHERSTLDEAHRKHLSDCQG